MPPSNERRSMMAQNIHQTDNVMVKHLDSIAKLRKHYFWHDHRYRLVLKKLPPTTQTLLDFGCGDGGFLRELAVQRPAIHLHGYDINTDTEALRRFTPISGQAIEAIRDWPPPHLRFDAITMLDVLEHIKDDCAELASLRPLIAPDGLLIITVPAAPFFWSHWDNMLGHYRRYSAKSLTATLSAAGFNTLYLSYFFSYLCPPALWRRLTFSPNSIKNHEAPEFPPISWATNSILRSCGALERKLLAWRPLPIGTSLIAVARPGADT